MAAMIENAVARNAEAITAPYQDVSRKDVSGKGFSNKDAVVHSDEFSGPSTLPE